MNLNGHRHDPAIHAQRVDLITRIRVLANLTDDQIICKAGDIMAQDHCTFTEALQRILHRSASVQSPRFYRL